MSRRKFLGAVFAGGLILAGLRLGEYDRLLDPLVGSPRLPDRRPRRARFFTTIVPSRLMDYYRRATRRLPRFFGDIFRLLVHPFSVHPVLDSIVAGEGSYRLRHPAAGLICVPHRR